MTDDQRGRDRLLAWRAEGPSNYYEASPNLARVLAVRAGSDQLAAMEPTLARFGRVVAETVEPAVAEVERHRQFPALLPYDYTGQAPKAPRPSPGELHSACGTVAHGRAACWS
jgi:hypothetical protein